MLLTVLDQPTNFITMFGKAVYAEDERVYNEQRGSLATARFRPLSYGAKERLRISCNDMAFMGMVRLAYEVCWRFHASIL